MSGMAAAVLALWLNEVAYARDRPRRHPVGRPRQTEAAHALGMPRPTTRRIVLPQAMRVIIPPTGNETITMLKTSLVAVIAGQDLMSAVQTVLARTTSHPAARRRRIWYLALVSVLSARAVLPRAPVRRRRPRTASADAGSDAAWRDDGRTPRGRTMTARWSTPRGVRKHFGRLDVLKGIDLTVAPGEVVCLIGPVRLGQVDLPALHQPPRDASTAAGSGRRRARRLPPARRQAPRAARARGRRAAAATSAWSSSASTSSRT